MYLGFSRHFSLKCDGKMKRSKTVLNNMMWRFLERTGARLVTALVEIILARILDPEHFGVIALVTVFIRLFQIFVDSGLANALIQKKNAEQVDFSSVFYFNILACPILYTILFFSSPFIAAFYKMPELTPVLRVLGIVLIVSGLKSVQQAYVSRHLLFKRFFWATLIGTLFAAAVGILMAYRGYGIWALVAQHLVNTIVDTIVLWITVKWRPTRQFSWERLKGLLSYGWKLLASSLLNTISNELRQLIVGRVYSSSDLGIYNRGRQLPHLFVTNINTSIDSVMLPTMSSVQDDKERVRSITRRAIKTSSYLLMPLMMGLAVCAEPIVRLLLTEKWLPAVFYLRVFCFTYAFYPIHTANLNAIKAVGRSDIFLKLELIKKAYSLAVLLITAFISMKALAISSIFTSILSQVINSWPNKKLLDYHYRDQLKDIMPHVFMSCLMGAVVYCIHFFHLNDWLTLMIQIPLGVAIYYTGSKVLHIDSLGYVLGVAKSYLKKEKKAE